MKNMAMILLVAVLAAGGRRAAAQTNLQFTAATLLDANTVRLAWTDSGTAWSCTDSIAAAPAGFWRILAGPTATNRWYVAERCSQLGQPFYPSKWALGTWSGNCVTNAGTAGNDLLQNYGTAGSDCLIQQGNGGNDVLNISAASSISQEFFVQEGGAGNDVLTAVGGSGGGTRG